MAVVQGVTYIQNWKGDEAVTVPGTKTTQAANFQNIKSVPLLSPQQAIIAERLTEVAKSKYVDDASKSHPSINWVNNPIGPTSEEFMRNSVQGSLTALRRVGNDIQKENRRQQELKRQAENLEKQSETILGSLFNKLVGAALDFAKKQINKFLPAELNVDIGVSYNADGELSFSGLSVGDISYNAEENSINYKGNAFNALAQDGLSAVNKLLPDFLQLSMSDLSINLGSVSVDLDELEANPGRNFSLGNNVTAQFDGQQIVTKVGNQIFKMGAKKANSLIKDGLSGLNRVLPSGLQANVSFPENGLGLPALELGFMQVDLASGGLVFNPAKAQSFIGSQLDNHVFKQLPAPLAGIARSVWKSVNLGNIFGWAQQRPDPSPNETLNAVSEDQSGTPPMIVPSSGLGAPASTNDSIQDTSGAYGNIA